MVVIGAVVCTRSLIFCLFLVFLKLKSSIFNNLALRKNGESLSPGAPYDGENERCVVYNLVQIFILNRQKPRRPVTRKW